MTPIELAPFTMLPDTNAVLDFSTADAAGQDDDHDLSADLLSGNGTLTVEKQGKRRFRLLAGYQSAHVIALKLTATGETIANLPVNVDDQRVATVSYTVVA